MLLLLLPLLCVTCRCGMQLMHMGRETCRKLADLQAAAQQASMDLGLEQHLACVDKVGTSHRSGRGAA